MHALKDKAAVILFLASIGILLMASSCDSGEGAGQKKESQIQQNNYDRLSKSEPAHTMDTSPTRKTINFSSSNLEKILNPFRS